MNDAASHLVNSGAQCLALCANTAHVYFDRLVEKTDVPIIHIASATASAIHKKSISKVGLLGTKMTMESTFYQDVLLNEGITTLIPNPEERKFINDVIFKELFYSNFKNESRKRFLDIMERLISEGAEGIILGCTEIPLLIKQEHTSIPVFNTLDIHAKAIVEFAIQ